MKSNVRELLYLFIEDKKVISYGIEFKEFIMALNSKPKHILVLKGQYGTHFDFNTLREYCDEEDLEEFIKEDVYSYGDFSWVDFCDVTDLDNLTDQEIAELYFFANKWQPLSSSYFKSLNNRFFYNAHDDGWTNWIYYHKAQDLVEVVNNVIKNKLESLFSLKNIVVDEGEMNLLFKKATTGVVIDFRNVSSGLKVYEVGTFTDMDLMIETLENKTEHQWSLTITKGSDPNDN
jgi:hypothetical protein